MGSTPKKTDTFDSDASVLSGVIAKIDANRTGSKQIPIGGQTVTVSSLTSDFQSFVDTNSAVETAKESTQAQVAKRQELKTSTKIELSDFTKWAVLQYGESAYAMFSLPQPKPRVVSPTKKAIGIQKQKATVGAKAQAKAAAAPKEEVLVAYDASGNPIGGNAVVPSANAAAPASAAPAAASGAAPGTTGK